MKHKLYDDKRLNSYGNNKNKTHARKSVVISYVICVIIVTRLSKSKGKK